MKNIIDPNYLACQHHLYMTLGVNLMVQQKRKPPRKVEVAVIGLGGGGLCTFMRQCLRYHFYFSQSKWYTNLPCLKYKMQKYHYYGGWHRWGYANHCYKLFQSKARRTFKSVNWWRRRISAEICGWKLVLEKCVCVCVCVFLTEKNLIADDNYDAILFDVDSKDSSLGMSCPPQQFLNATVLDNVKKCLGSKGWYWILSINLTI